MVAEMDETLTVKVEDAAKMLGISRGLMFRMVREKRIRSLRFGRRILISRKLIDAMLSADWQQPTG
jgi:excisionase family DNA binding protein